MLTFEYHQSLELLQKGKESSLKTIHDIGMNDSDYITSGMNVFSHKFKNFIESMNIKNLNFIPITISQENHQRKDFYLLKFTQNEDCIDYEKSDIVIIQGLIRKINKLKLRMNLITFFSNKRLEIKNRSK